MYRQVIFQTPKLSTSLLIVEQTHSQASACRVPSDPQSAALEAAKIALAARQVRLYDCYDIMVMCLYCDCRVTHWVTHAEKLFVSPALEPKYCFYVSC